jgi:hypothetical protein
MPLPRHFIISLIISMLPFFFAAIFHFDAILIIFRRHTPSPLSFDIFRCATLIFIFIAD